MAITPVGVVMALVLTAIISGCEPTLIESIAVVPGLISTTVLFDVRITDTVPEVRLATYTYAPSGLATTPVGALPTTIGERTVCPVNVLITDTVLVP